MASEEKIGKLDIATHHVMAAIQMISVRCNPYAVHLVAMAADELVETVAEKTGATLSFSSSRWIKEEHRKDWFKGKRKFYNYFKHADRDHDAEYVGPDPATLQMVNDLLLLMACYGLGELGHETPDVFNSFTVLVFGFYPHLYNWDALIERFPRLKDGYADYVGKFTRRDYESVLRITLTGQSALDLDV
ncbi:hypothetical protein [Rhizobium leguminosarum]|uniref:hypothetical protein n=1 Tax=Rhizobium leguminosarum TaxID=384 RepID=UPI001C9385BC|nr:hypothetical protein [Rhizobium leguminosarum]MBY5610898.1 hypothetical protein [Rhizobium leguminosarum]